MSRRFDPATRYVEEDRGHDTPCWIWQGSVRNRYGCLGDNGRVVYAHRWFYEHYIGPIPEGLSLDHLCRQVLCVNPAHLEPVTHAENCQRGRNATLAKEQVRAMRAEDAEHMRQRRLAGKVRRRPNWLVDIAAKYGVTWSCARQILDQPDRVWRGVQ